MAGDSEDDLDQGTQTAKQAGRHIGQRAAKAAGKLALKGAKAGGKALLTTPWGWVLLGGLLAVFLIFSMVAGATFGIQTGGDFNLDNKVDAADSTTMQQYSNEALADWPGTISLYGQESQTTLSWGAIYIISTLSAQANGVNQIPYKLHEIGKDLAQTQEFAGTWSENEDVTQLTCKRANHLPCYVYQDSQVTTTTVTTEQAKDPKTGKTTTKTTSSTHVTPVKLLVHARTLDYQCSDGSPGCPLVDNNNNALSLIWYKYHMVTTVTQAGNTTITTVKPYPWGTVTKNDNATLDYIGMKYGIFNVQNEKDINPLDRNTIAQLIASANHTMHDPNQQLQTNLNWLLGNSPATGNLWTQIGSISLSGVPQELVDAVKAAAQRFGIDWAILAALLYQESNFCQNAVPSMGADGQNAYGCAQFEMATWQTYGVDGNGDGIADVNNPIDAIFGAANYLSHLGMTTDPSSWAIALKRYNCGWAAADANPNCDMHNGQHYSDQIIARAQQLRQNGIQPAGGMMIWPVPTSSTISSGFGDTSGRGTPHIGVDIAAPCGSQIIAAAGGTVIDSGPATGYGDWIVVDSHNGYLEIYGHMFPNGLHVSTGQSVQAGQYIADVGENGEATGCHLHFSVWQGKWPVNVSANGQYINPLPLLSK